mmetsp:Transcript_9931/g.14920  ORF Transcript_9931/g.14920 Transcript_9931/m.14920 type:complete len:342 (+) Transcript_9931:1-1026(+)
MRREQGWKTPGRRKRAGKARKFTCSSSEEVRKQVLAKDTKYKSMDKKSRLKAQKIVLQSIEKRKESMESTSFVESVIGHSKKAVNYILNGKVTSQVDKVNNDGKKEVEGIEHKSPKGSTNEKSEKKSIEVICYGLGSISDSPNAQYQLALILLVSESLKKSIENLGTINVYLYDPVLTLMDKDVLIEIGLKTLSINEQCKRKVEIPTLFYMPHCSRGMYNNVVWANWGHRLSGICLLGNSFSNYMEKSNLQAVKAKAEIASLLAVRQFVNEVGLHGHTFKIKGVFNDLSIHTFVLPGKVHDDSKNVNASGNKAKAATPNLLPERPAELKSNQSTGNLFEIL